MVFCTNEHIHSTRKYIEVEGMESVKWMKVVLVRWLGGIDPGVCVSASVIECINERKRTVNWWLI